MNLDSFGEGKAVRESKKGKGRFDLITPFALDRIAKRYEFGQDIYGDARNWEKGMPWSKFIDSAMRHINEFRKGNDSEDHLAAACWNLMCIMHFQELDKVNDNDLPNYNGVNGCVDVESNNKDWDIFSTSEGYTSNPEKASIRRFDVAYRDKYITFRFVGYDELGDTNLDGVVNLFKDMLRDGEVLTIYSSRSIGDVVSKNYVRLNERFKGISYGMDKLGIAMFEEGSLVYDYIIKAYGEH